MRWAPAVVGLACCSGGSSTGSDADRGTVIVIDANRHHLGDSAYMGVPPEGTMLSAPFHTDVDCPAASIELDFVGPWGIHWGNDPEIDLDATMLGSVLAQFPPLSDPRWVAGDFDGDYSIHIALPAHSAVLAGDHTLDVIDHDSADDFFFENLVLRCYSST